MTGLKYLITSLLVLFGSGSLASTVDWSTVTLSGSSPNFSFTDPVLGTVTLAYSNTEYPGIYTYGDVALTLGNTGDETLLMSWSNAITELIFPVWDVDKNTSPGKGEALTFVTTAFVEPVQLHSTDRWDAATNTLSTDGTNQSNSSATNFSLMRFTDVNGFSEIRFDLNFDNGFGGIGIGDMQFTAAVPLPPALLLMMSGIGALWSFGRLDGSRRCSQASA